MSSVFTLNAVSTGRSKIEDFRDHERLRLSDDVDSECPTPSPRFKRARAKIFTAAFASLFASNPQAEQECSRTQNGLSVFTPHDAHSFIVFFGSPSTKCVPSRLQLSWFFQNHYLNERVSLLDSYATNRVALC